MCEFVCIVAELKIELVLALLRVALPNDTLFMGNCNFMANSEYICMMMMMNVKVAKKPNCIEKSK